MPKASSPRDETAEILKDLLIVQLGVAGVPQAKIREIVGCNIVRVNRIVRYLKQEKAEKRKSGKS
jgi:hypothetical protein